MQHERDALLRSQLVEDDQRGHPEPVVPDGDVEGVFAHRLPERRHDRLGQPLPDVSLALFRGRLEAVQADPADDGGQPAAQVADGGAAGVVEPGQPQPRLLHRVLGVGPRAGQPVGHPDQVTAMPGELFGEPIGERSRAHNPECAARARTEEN